MREIITLRIVGKRWLKIVLFFSIILCLIPVSGYAEVYHYIDVDGVERYSNTPPPEGATIIGKEKEIEYDEAADRTQQEQNQEAAADYIEQNTPSESTSPQPSSTTTPSTENKTNIYINSDDDTNYHRRPRRHKQIHRK